MRSLLFVPGDSERKLAKAADAGADVVILDLEDAVAADAKATARERVRAFLKSPRSGAGLQYWVRINALDSRDALLDLSAIVRAAPHGLMVPKVAHPSELTGLSKVLSELEAEAGIALGSTRLIPMLETPRGILTAGDYLQLRLERLSAITWGAHDLAAAMGVHASGDGEGDDGGGGEWHFVLRSAQVQCLLVASALAVAAIDTVTADFKNLEALHAACLRSRAAGFTGKLAIHPDQVKVIAEVFRPSPADLEQARRVIAAFAAAPGTGVIALDGTMLDIVHLHAARRLLDGQPAPKA
jgi:citrate lyase subunit beta/citryl-CoA lyase